jgi:hypothetical protein
LTASISVPESDDDWETLLRARKRSGVGLSDLIEAIREKRIPVGQRTGVVGFHGIAIYNRDVDGLASENRKSQNPVEVELPGEMSAAEFGRSVGLRDNGSFLALVEAGQTPAMQCLSARTGRPQYRLSTEDISAFHRRFVTLPTLSEETGYHRNTLKRRLEASRIHRFTPNGQDFGPAYLRENVTNALK